MAYSDFTLPELEQRLGLTLDEEHNLFQSVASYPPSELLTALLAVQVPLTMNMNTEKARSELIISPVLVEVYRSLPGRMSFFSGIDFTVDRVQGLTGVCDFIIGRGRESLYLRRPAVVIIEAKNENFVRSFPQCGAAMVAAQRFNADINNPEAPDATTIYGAVTTGNVWRFLRLDGTALHIDTLEYYINDPGKILGILRLMVTGDPIPVPAGT